MSQSSCGVALRKTYLGATCTKRPTVAFQMNDHQNLSKIASCTPVFTKFEPIIGKSTTPQMDKWRPKTMRRAPKSRLFRSSARPFFHQKIGRTLFEYIGEPCQLIEIQQNNYLTIVILSCCHLVKIKMKIESKLLINIYHYCPVKVDKYVFEIIEI